jgi:hypothetical protein
MKHIFIAVGGSGTKVAEALVNLLAIGFPTRITETGLTSEGDTLELWRLDPDGSSGAADGLQHAVDNYNKMQVELGGKWGITIDSDIRHLDPLRLLQQTGVDNKIKTLEGILDSGYEGLLRSQPFLQVFYQQKDLEVTIDRGFYQKPFIGSAVMAAYVESLNYGNSDGGSQCRMTYHESLDVRFFLCGSLHGGTGASGVPIMGKYLKRQRDGMQQANRWQIGACLLTPYAKPPDPPFNQLPDESLLSEDLITERVQHYGNTEAFRGLSIGEQRELAKQILLGFYASPKDMVARAGQGLLYYQDHAGDCFDALYLVGKPAPDELRLWSNGGKSQQNPGNSAEVVAALAALDFFSATNPKQSGYIVGTSTPTLESGQMRLSDLPQYRVREVDIDPERAFLATAIMYHCVLHEVTWNVAVAQWNKKSLPALKEYYGRDENKKNEDRLHFFNAANYLFNFVAALVFPDRTMGWSVDAANALSRFLSHEESLYRSIRTKMEKKSLFNDRAKEPLSLGQSQIDVTAFDFGRWTPPNKEFTRGEYMRHIWHQLYTKDQPIH